MDRSGGHPGWLLLASRSPRRRSLLADAGLAPIVIDPGVDDGALTCGAVGPIGAAWAWSFFKAAAVALRAVSADRVVLGADTFVVKAGVCIGKPTDAADADRMIRLLSDGAHEVITGVCLIDRRSPASPGPRRFLVDRARVEVGLIGEAQRSAYLATGDWRGKAGAYNYDERVADGWPLRTTGDPATVMGLPMRRLTPMLERLRAGVDPDAAEEPKACAW